MAFWVDIMSTNEASKWYSGLLKYFAASVHFSDNTMIPINHPIPLDQLNPVSTSNLGESNYSGLLLAFKWACEPKQGKMTESNYRIDHPLRVSLVLIRVELLFPQERVYDCVSHRNFFRVVNWSLRIRETFGIVTLDQPSKREKHLYLWVQ